MSDAIEVLQAREALRLIDAARELLSQIAGPSPAPKKPTRPVSREAQNEMIRELFELGHSRVEIGQRVGLARETVAIRLLQMERKASA